MNNPLKQKLKQGKPVIGTFVGLGHPDVTESLSRLGFDFLLLDAEHGPLGFETLQLMMQSMNGSNCIPIIRPQWNDFIIIKRILDMGAYGVLVPWVNSKSDAENAVRASKYPPVGVRGFGPRRAGIFDNDYYITANDEILVAIQIETAEAVSNLVDIVSVEGVDACYIGPYDLSSNMGLGVPPKWDNPKYLEVFDQVLTVTKRYGKAAGMFTGVTNINWALEKGFTFNTVGDADSFLIQGAQSALSKIEHR